MIYRDFQDLHLSLLGFGTMRLPTTADGAIDEDTTQAMVDYALAHGVNYFDTAWAYMQNLSETVVGRCLKKHPRDSFYLATKYPGHTLTCDPDPADTFAQQLEKCQVDYFDFYLLHNVYENDVDIYTDPQWGIIDYFVEQKRLGRIKHLGFSFHDKADVLDDLLNKHPNMEFVQLQINYADWESTSIQSRACYEVARKHGKPVVIMEPVKGGSLADLPEKIAAPMKEFAPNASLPSWAIRYAASLDGLVTVLSGMSSLEQMKDNLSFMENFKPLSAEEYKVVDKVVAALNAVPQIPCTACQYCTKGCPQQIKIPGIFKAVNNELVYGNRIGALANYAFATRQGGKADDCIACGQCEAACPQHIHIIEELQKAAQMMEG